jgi:iron complex transport system permease protein
MKIRTRGLVVALVWLLALIVLLAIAIGPTGLRAPWDLADPIIALRAPRVLLAAIVGASLALSGAAMQVLLQNDMADPYILGLSGGASVGAVASLALWPALPPGPAAAVGAAGAAVLVQLLARGPYDPLRLLLSGIAVSSILGSITGLILTLAPAERLLRSATFWLFGGLGTPEWSALLLPAILLVSIGAWMFQRAERLDRLSLGSDVATSLGVDVRATRRRVLIASVLLTAVAVAAAGLVGFVGLMAPHAARLMRGAGHRALLPLTLLGGAILLVGADTLARSAFAPREVPVGLLTAALGGPFFLAQLHRATQKLSRGGS